MSRIVLFMIFLAAASAVAVPAGAAALRGAEIHVAGDMVTLGDLFSDAGANAGQEVAKAPPAGKTIVMDSAALYGLAVGNHLDWQPRGMTDKVIVFRDGDAVTGMPASPANINLDAVISPLRPALSAAGAGEKLAILLDGGDQQRLLAGIAENAALAVDKLSFDAAAKRFSATLADATTGQRYTVAGRAIALVRIPVPARRILQGDTVGATDVSWIEQRADQLRSDTVQNADAMLGKVAKRQLEANLPVQQRFLALPAVIRRGDRVTMVVNNSGIILTAEGRALSDAGIGETVHLANAASNKEIDGIATGAGTAEIRTESAIVAAMSNNASTVIR